MKNSVIPNNEEELSQLVGAAARENTPLCIVGAGTKQALGIKIAGKPVSTTGLTGIEIYEPAALTIVASAGTPLQQINDALVKSNQHLPFEPADYSSILGTSGDQTIGGLVACAVSGPRRIQAGALRDSLIGVRFVNGEGEVIKSGGRVMKNVTGYDLVKLLAGSYGTLGIITQVSFKLLPAPEYTASINISHLTDIAAVGAMSAALGSPYDVSGAAHISSKENRPVTVIRLEGFEKSVRYRVNQLKELLSRLNKSDIDILEQDQAMEQWRNIRDVTQFAGKEGAIWRLSVKPGDAPAIVETISDECDVEALYDWGGGLVWLLTSSEKDGAEDIVRTSVNKFGGHATLIRQCEGNHVKNVFHPQSAPVTMVSAALRKQFDPYSILNPGRMGS